MKKDATVWFSFTLIAFYLFLPFICHAAEPWSQQDADELQALQEYVTGKKDPNIKIHIAGMGQLVADNVDPKVKLAQNLLAVRKGQMTPQDFYLKLSQINFGGTEPRHALMQIKKDIANYRGTSFANQGLEFFFDTPTKGGGSAVELSLLDYRKKLMEQGVQKVLNDFKGRNVVNGTLYSVYFVEAGSWPKETLAEMKFVSDIDIGFMCGNLELSMAMKQEFDSFIKSVVNMSPDSIDIPCTAHGLGTDEVFIGKHGQGKAETMLDYVKEILFDGSPRIGEKVDFKKALKSVLIEAKSARVGLPDLDNLKWPKEPGVSLEMIRHFEHDIVAKNVFSDFESFIKAAKYLERSNKSLVEAGGTIKDQKLAAFAEALVANKTKPEKALSKIVNDYFDSIGKPVPFEVKLGSQREGKLPVTLEANKAFIGDFWKTCSETMWQNANKGFETQISKIKSSISSLDPKNSRQVVELGTEVQKIREMMEIESRVLRDPTAGLHNIPKQFDTLMGEFRSTVSDFMQKAGVELMDVKTKQAYKFIEEMLKTKQPNNVKLAIGAMLETPEKINNYMDVLDNVLMGELRGERTMDWKQFLERAQEIKWGEKVDLFLEGTRWKGKWSEYLNQKQEKIKPLEESFNKFMFDNMLSRGIRDANRSFARSVEQSRGGQVTMKAMMAMNLAQEIPLYIELFAKGEWSEFATEFFRRRVPFGYAVEDVFMGNYLCAVWDSACVLFPPAGLFDMAAKMGKELGAQSWNIYWSEEMEKFVDELYDKAKFKLLGVEKYGEDIKLSRWRLDTIEYQGKAIDILKFISEKESQIAEMQKYLAKKTQDRQAEGFPTQYLTDGITGWLGANDILKESLRQKDPWLMLIEEMMKHPNVGPKMKEFYQEQWYTRFEIVKLDWVKHIKEVLEKRRAGEQALLSGQLPKMYEELQKIAKELEIEKEMNESLKEELGSDFYQFLVSLTDWMKGLKRDLLGEPGVWDVYEEKAVVIQEYLREYKLIHKNRGEAEKHLSATPPVVDSGLRLLTGRWFFEGKVKKDKATSPTWVRLPVESEVTIEEKLREIISRCADTRELDKDEESFDQKTLRALVFHDVFRQMWKYVFNVAQKGKESVLETAWRGAMDYKAGDAASDMAAEFVLGNENKEQQEQALNRYKFHASQVKALIKQFEQHYCTEDKVDISKLEEIAKKIEALVAEASRLCSSAIAGINSVKASMQGIISKIGPIEHEVKRFNAVKTEMNRLISDMNQNHKEVEKATVKIGEISAQLDKKANEVCELTNKLKNITDSSERASLARNIQNYGPLVQDLFNQAKSIYQGIKTTHKNTREMLTKFSEAKKDADKIADVSGFVTSLEELHRVLDAAGDKINAAKQKIAEIKKLQIEARKLEGELRKALLPQSNTEKGKEKLKKLDELIKKINSASGTPESCLATANSSLTVTERDLNNLEKRVKDLETAIKGLREVFGEVGQPSPKETEAKSIFELIDYLHDMAVRYVERVAIASSDADYCIRLADTMRQGQETCARWPGSVPVWDQNNQLSCDCPKEKGLAWNKDQTACIDARQAAVENTDCSRWPGSIPLWNNQTNRAECFCPQGLAWNRDRTMCIDARQAAIESTDCSRWPGSIPLWNNQTNRAECFCPQGMTWNRDRTMCIDARQAAVENTDCSRWPGSISLWNNQTNRAECFCPQGMAWNKDRTRCIDARQAAVENTDCTRWPGSIPQWNNQINRAECFCPQGMAWNRDRTRCIDARQAAIESTDCSRWPGSIPLWNNQTNRAECFCPQGMVWNQNRTACISARQQPPPGPGPTPTGPPRQVRCNDTAKQGGNKPETLVVDLGRTSGVFRFDYDMYDVPDRMIVRYGGGTYDTQCTGGKQGRGRDKGSVNLQFFGSSQVTIQVLPACQGGSTSWKFTVHCPK